jgi:hypothetical protein
MGRVSQLDIELSGFMKAGHFDQLNNCHLLKSALCHSVLSCMWKHVT